jgi:hypothetical protein
MKLGNLLVKEGMYRFPVKAQLICRPPKIECPMKIFCNYDQLLPVSVLETKRHPKNPNQHSAAQIAAIAQVLEGNGWRQAVVVSTRSGLITRGHGRLEAALLLGAETVPVDFQEYESEQAEIADMIADNRLSELSEMDEGKLVQVLKELQAAGHDVALAGFTEDELARLINVDEETDNLETIPQMELQPFEHYDYLIFMFHDLRDWLRVLQLLNITKVNYSISRKTQKIGIGRVLNGKRLLQRLDDPARDNVTGTEQPSDHAQASATGHACSA